MRRTILLVLALLVGAGVMAGCDVHTYDHPWWLTSQRCGIGDAHLHIEENWNANSHGTTHFRTPADNCNTPAPTPIAAGTVGVAGELYDHDGLCKDGGFGYEFNGTNQSQVLTGTLNWTGPETCQVNNSWEDYYTRIEHVIGWPAYNDYNYGGTNSPVIRFCRGSCS